MRRCHNFPLTTKTLILAVSGLLLLAILTFFVADHALTGQAAQPAEERQEGNRRVAWQVLHGYRSDFHRERNDLYARTHKRNSWDESVDTVKRLVGGTATIFRGDMRAEEEAKRTRDQLTGTQSAVGVARGAVQRVDHALAAIVDTVGEVHQLLGGMAADNQSQSAAICEISTAIGGVDRATQQNAATVEETSAAARQRIEQVARLDAHAGTFRTGGEQAQLRTPVPADIGRHPGPLAGAAPVSAMAGSDDWASF